MHFHYNVVFCCVSIVPHIDSLVYFHHLAILNNMMWSAASEIAPSDLCLLIVTLLYNCLLKDWGICFLALHLLRKACCYVVRCPTDRIGPRGKKVRVPSANSPWRTEFCQQFWVSWEEDPPPVQPSGKPTTLKNTLTGSSWETLSWRHPDKLHTDFWTTDLWHNKCLLL